MKNNEQQIALRVDASTQIGTGHFMRCLTMADALRERGARPRFVSRHLPEYLRSKLAEKGHDFVLLQGASENMAVDELAHAPWLGVSQSQDADATINALSDQHWDWIIVDHYALDCRWESRLRRSADKILAIDDIADRQHDCDVLLDQNLYADMETRYADKVPAHCQQLLGPRYALLRDEFRRLRQQVKPRSGVVRRVLVFFGGMDIDNYTSQAIAALAQSEISEVHVDVVIGAQHPARQQIEKECELHGFDSHVQTDRMAELMANADLAIGAGGSASWERCCLGLPAILVALADNQIDIAKTLDVYGVSVFAGTLQTVNASTLLNEVTKLVNGYERYEKMSREAYSLVDGSGVDRVCQESGLA